MDCILKKITIVDDSNVFNGKTVDILIKNGLIEDIGNIEGEKSIPYYEFDKAFISPGWFDIGTRLTEPGYESIDDISSISRSASKGGFTGLAVFPNTNPPIDNKSQLSALLSKSNSEITDFFPVGCASKSNNGQELSEMYDLYSYGAVAFSDGKLPIAHAGLMSRALKYASQLPAPVINHPEDAQLRENGQVNESHVSVYLGLKGIPALAESMMLTRDILLAEYNDASLISHMISLGDSVELIKQSKKRGVKVDATVSYHNLISSEEELINFNSLHKVLPPLRNDKDIQKLVNGVKDGTVSAIVSNHYPLDEEDKKKAFYDTKYGALGLESMFGLLNLKLGKVLGIDVLIERISNGPRRILNIPPVKIQKGSLANLTIFDLESKGTFSNKDIKSKSNNSPFIGHPILGKVIGVINKNKILLNN